MKKELSESSTTKKINNTNKPDKISNTKRVLTLLDEHPEAGVIAGGALTASGISAMVVYGIKLARA